MAEYTEARRRANEKYNAKAYDEIKMRVPKGRKAELQAHADQCGESLNAFLSRAANRFERFCRVGRFRESRPDTMY